MYDDDTDLWPFKCPECGEEFTEQIGTVKANNFHVKCPAITLPGPIPCPCTSIYSESDFNRALAEAKKGLRDPWKDMVRIRRI